MIMASSASLRPLGPGVVRKFEHRATGHSHSSLRLRRLDDCYRNFRFGSIETVCLNVFTIQTRAVERRQERLLRACDCDAQPRASIGYLGSASDFQFTVSTFTVHGGSIIIVGNVFGTDIPYFEDK